MSKLIIKNGFVYDPTNSIEGEVKDIQIEDGKIVEKFSNETDVKEIDAKNKTVIPSGVDIHSHFASPQLNWVKLLGKNNPDFQNTWKGLTLRKVGADYVKNGYTFALEANNLPSLSKQTLFNFKNIPVIDKGMLINISNYFPLELEFQRGMTKEIGIFLSDLLRKTKGFGIKAYNPFEGEDWNFNAARDDIKTQGRLYNFTALEVYKNLTKVNEELNLPHSIHAHVEGYESEYSKQNLKILLDEIDNLELYPNNKNRNQVFHLAHASAYNIDGDNEELINKINSSDKYDLDLGIITFNQINPLITYDRRLFQKYWSKNELSKGTSKTISSAIELEGDTYASLRNIEKTNLIFSRMWLNAIELTLKVKNKWKIQLTLNYPNYGDINDISQIASWLLSGEARKEFANDLNKEIKSKVINTADQALSFNDYIIISRASPAKSLGIGNIKGNLGIAADGDLNILDINIAETDISSHPEAITSAFSDIEYVIKEGNIVKKQDNIDLSSQGKIFWTDGNLKDDAEKQSVLKKKDEFFTRYHSIFYNSFTANIDNKYLRKIM